MTKIDYEVRLPLVTKVDQYTEHFILVQDEKERELPVHDYQTIYQIPGLYQRLVVELLIKERQIWSRATSAMVEAEN